MGFFSSSNESNNSMKENKYVETIKATSLELLDKEITKRMETRIIKDIKFQVDGIFYAMIIYDAWAEKARNEKENVNEIEL
ncbi:hypothetical protein FNSP4_05670 [Fusobacterium nucleatum]|jgi:hypothetical protein|nr:hypothetical protein FNCP4_23590 [Fusobacterium nucleatum]BEP02833.1 hypothetical protein FNSP4_05670 [Fusobacterium nucleatum]